MSVTLAESCTLSHPGFTLSSGELIKLTTRAGVSKNGGVGVEWVMAKVGPEGMAQMMGENMCQGMPQMMAKMGRQEIASMMLDTMPRLMHTCFSGMDPQPREFMLTHCRGMLDQVEEKYLRQERT